MPKGNEIIRGFGQRIAELLSESPDDTGKAAEARAGEPAGDSGPADAKRMLQHVQSLLGDRAELAIGRVNFVNLDGVRQRLGDRWPRIADRVDAIVRRTIERRLGPSDLYTPLPGHRYLITFGHLPAAEATIKTAMIGDEIGRLLIGEDLGGEVMEVHTAVAAVDGRLRFEEIPSLQQLVEAIGEAPRPEAPERICEPEPPAADAGPVDRVQLVYRPMWDVRRNVVSTFVYVPAMPRGNRLVLGKSAIPGIDDPRVLQDLDARTMTKAVEDLGRIAESGRKLLLVVPLHFESVATGSRLTAYARLCRDIPGDLQQLLIFELVDVPVGIPQSRLLDLTSTLKRFSRSVLLRLPLADPLFRSPSDSGIAIVGATLTGLRLRERQIMRAFDRFCEGAHRAGLQTYVHGLRTLSLTTAAVSSGFDYVDGDTVRSVVDEPGNIYRFDARSMVRNWAAGRT